MTRASHRGVRMISWWSNDVMVMLGIRHDMERVME